MGFTVDVSLTGIYGTEIGWGPAPSAAESNVPPGSPNPGPQQPASGPTPPVAPPSLLDMAASFTASMARFAASGFRRVDAATYRARVDQCAGCAYRQGTRCQVCGCFVDKKAWLPHEDCPIGRWPV
ncbi:MAG: hypothetical protein A2W31_16730 [Planctomycetes bacterium RBG_16_64_10]|nr:MAG: hypothetical protein A2W31_16730 [Planctomycetes bacterium RBG_16_64_10]